MNKKVSLRRIFFGRLCLSVFVLSFCQNGVAFSSNPFAEPARTSAQPGVDLDTQLANHQETPAIPDPQAFWNPSPLTPSEPSPEETKPPDQNFILSSIEKENVQEKMDGLTEILLLNLAYESRTAEPEAMNRSASAPSDLPEKNSPPVGRVISFFKDRFEETRDKFRPGVMTPDFFMQAMPVLENLQALRNAITSPDKGLAAEEKQTWDQAMNFAAMNSLIHPPSDLHPFVRALFSRRFVSQDVFRDYLSALDKIRLQHHKILAILSERTDKAAIRSHLKNDLAGGVLEALIAKILKSRQ